eukprot:s2869_g10.t2
MVRRRHLRMMGKGKSLEDMQRFDYLSRACLPGPGRSEEQRRLRRGARYQREATMPPGMPVFYAHREVAYSSFDRKCLVALQFHRPALPSRVELVLIGYAYPYGAQHPALPFGCGVRVFNTVCPLSIESIPHTAVLQLQDPALSLSTQAKKNGEAAKAVIARAVFSGCAPKMGALLFQAMKALIPNDGEVSRQDLPKEVTCLPPKAPLLRPSVQSTLDINEIPDLVLPDAADVDMFDELEEIRPKFSVKAKGVLTSLEKVHQDTCKSILSVLASEEAGQKGFAELSERWDGRRRTSTCSTVASMTDLECSMTNTGLQAPCRCDVRQRMDCTGAPQGGINP